ncbi:DUF1127 domain-containing protein [Pseudomonas sp. PDM22]|uniref:DUF1127 domain-containing protein n=2 Tax=Pseudomonadales TaxID=72274 RepID=A0A9X7R3I9_PSEDE|nr:DUF1127 domain-containing protein [Pseudomonas sp. PDM22]MBD9629156.1 DUF1127 domain-containing protein [Pseudomonas sp. PDM19]MBD9684583.1 DUF1127 domain-containing protein [Pseudomonas sp. PDM20]QEY71319.1 DUF1127 domain-containing protein [Pseudomonas denitrificans (nom. rej.)]
MEVAMNHTPRLLLPEASRRSFSLSSLLQLLALWQTRARVRRQLACMARANPHLIEDIGLTRRRVAQEIAKPFWRA